MMTIHGRDFFARLSARFLSVAGVVATIGILWLVACGHLVWNVAAILRLEQDVARSNCALRGYEDAARMLSEGSVILTLAVRRYVVLHDASALTDYFREVSVDRHREKTFSVLAGLPVSSKIHGELRSAMQNSLDLMQIEFRAMKLVVRATGTDETVLPRDVRRTALATADRSLSPAEQLRLAERLVFDETYEGYKARIHGGVETALANLIARERTKYDELDARRHSCGKVMVMELVVCVVLLVLLLVIALVINHRRLSNKDREMLEKVNAEKMFALEIVNRLPRACCLKDAADNFRYLICNQAFCELVGRPLDQLLGHTDEEIFSAEELLEIRSHDLEILAFERGLDSEGVLVLPSGEPRRLRHSSRLLHEGTRRLVLTLLEDVTEESIRRDADLFKSAVLEFICAHEDRNTTLDFLAERLRQVTRCRHVMLQLADGTRKDWFASDLEKGLCSVCAECPLRCAHRATFGKGNQVQIEDTAELKGFQLPSGCRVKALVAQQIVYGGTILGHLGILFTDHPRRFPSESRQLMQVAAGLAAIVLHRSVSPAQEVRS